MSTSAIERPLHRRVFGRLPTILWLTAMWAILWGDPSPGTVIAGFGVACGCYAVARLPHIPVPLRIRPLWLLRLAGSFGLDLLVSSAQVAYQVLLRPTRMRGAIVAVPTRTGSDLLLAMMSGGLSLVTGSLVIELNRDDGVVYLHGIPVSSDADVAKLRTQVQRTEELFVRTFGTAEDIAEFEAAQRAIDKRAKDAAASADAAAPKEAP